MRNLPRRQRLFLQLTGTVCVFTMATVSVGCRPSGPTYWPIDGKVTFQGRPVTIGQIRFCNSGEGIDVIESLNAEGQYTVVTGSRKGLPEGQYQVAVIPKLDFSRVKNDKHGFPIPSTMPSEGERNPPNIPRKYHDPSTSGLTATVKPEPNTVDVDMQ
jgi:hypothetical protein